MDRPDFSRITFVADPAAFPIQADDRVAWIPAHITDHEVLFAHLKRQLPFPDVFRRSWAILQQYLPDAVFGDVRRAVILHADVPALPVEPNGWRQTLGYLSTLAYSVQLVQEQWPHQEKELLVVFPSSCYEQIKALFDLPDEWDLWYGLDGGVVVGDLYSPPWPFIQHALSRLDGVTVDKCSIHHPKAGELDIMTVRSGGYCLTYSFDPHAVPAAPIPLDPHASYPESIMAMTYLLPTPETSAMETFATLLQTVAAFIRTGGVMTETPWRRLTIPGDYFDANGFEDDEDIFLEWDENQVQCLIMNGMERHPDDGWQDADIPAWVRLLRQGDLQDRLSALCVIGRSQLSRRRALLLPFLESPWTAERWVSARFLAPLHEEKALPVLLQMLTEEVPLSPLSPGEERDEWYDNWRVYGPRLLRGWQHPDIIPALTRALHLNLETESYAPHRFLGWYRFRSTCCRELGRREAFDALDSFDRTDVRVRVALVQIAQGYYLAQQQYSSLRAEMEQVRTLMDDQNARPALCQILETRAGLTHAEACTLIERYEDDECEVDRE